MAGINNFQRICRIHETLQEDYLVFGDKRVLVKPEVARVLVLTYRSLLGSDISRMAVKDKLSTKFIARLEDPKTFDVSSDYDNLKKLLDLFKREGA